MMIDSVAVGKKIAKLRKERNFTQDELAEKLYVTRQALSKWENGLSVPGVEMLIVLSEFFNTSFEEILCLNDSKTIDPNNIFSGHSRLYVVNKLINNEIAVKLSDVFYLLSPLERMMVLKGIVDGRCQTNLDELKVKLTVSEQKYLANGGL